MLQAGTRHLFSALCRSIAPLPVLISLLTGRCCLGLQVGIIHTNYLDYARREEQGDLKEKFLKALNSWVCRVHCHKVSMAWAFSSVQLPSNACCMVC